MPSLASADLHIHADDTTVDALVAGLRTSDLTIAVIVYHNDWQAAQTMVNHLRLDGVPQILIAGVELSTSQGHLLAIDIDAELEMCRPLDASIAAVHVAGGIAVIAHPGFPHPGSAKRSILRTLASAPPAARPDGLEIANRLGAFVPGHQTWMSRFARAHDFAITGGSDAHQPHLIGRGRTAFIGATQADLFQALRDRRTAAHARRDSLADIVSFGLRTVLDLPGHLRGNRPVAADMTAVEESVVALSAHLRHRGEAEAADQLTAALTSVGSAAERLNGLAGALRALRRSEPVAAAWIERLLLAIQALARAQRSTGH